MNPLFGDEQVSRPTTQLAPDAIHVPDWLSLAQQQWLVARFYEWSKGPVPLRAAAIRGHKMSVKTVCLGWHWRPYQYSRAAVDVNGNQVLEFPEWMVRLGRQALAATLGADDDYTPDTALVNYYDTAARLGMHQDKDEKSLAPVVSLSIGDTCQFRFGNPHNRNKPYQDIGLASGDLVVFGGRSRLAFHGVPRIYPDTAPAECGLACGRVNITMRVTGMS